MPRHLKYNPADKLPEPLGDRGWIGVDMRRDPSELPPGYMSLAINTRFRAGKPETRLGSVLLPWLNKITAGLVQPWTTLYGVGSFRDPITATEYVLLAADGNVYRCLANNPPVALSLPSGVTVTTRCRFIQCFNVVVLLRGYDDDPLVMNSIFTGFEAITRSLDDDVEDGTEDLPRALRGLHAANRLFLAAEDDVLWSSDILDYTRGSILDDFRVNQGSADRLVALEQFGDATIVALKGRSIYAIDNVYGNLAGASLRRITSRYGCVAPETVVDCGTDLLWLSQEGIASLTLTQQNEVQAGQGAASGKNPMFSEKIEPLIKRINWKFAHLASAALYEQRYYIALPIDQAEVLGTEFVPGGVAQESVALGPLVAGATYRFTLGNATSLTNGSETLTASKEFTAQGTSATLLNTSGVATTSGLQRVRRGVNSVIAVYDFQNGEWSGYDVFGDEGAMFQGVQQLFVATWLGRERLFVLTHDGYVMLYEEDYTDRLPVPYVDVTVSSLPTLVGGVDTIRVNSGVTAAAVNFSYNFEAPSNFWGASTLAFARQNLFTDISSIGGFFYGTLYSWTAPVAPNTLTVQITNGVRFYSTNGVLPVVVTTGTWATVREYTEMQVKTTWVTRGYVAPSGDLADYRHLSLDVQTWHPEFSVSLLTEGVNEETVLVTDRTKSRTAYYRPHTAAAYALSNANNDFDTPYREDYAAGPEPTSSPASYSMTPGDGIRGDLHQESRETFRVQASGRAARIQITSTQGRLRLMGAMLETNRKPSHPGVAA